MELSGLASDEELLSGLASDEELLSGLASDEELLSGEASDEEELRGLGIVEDLPDKLYHHAKDKDDKEEYSRTPREGVLSTMCDASCVTGQFTRSLSVVSTSGGGCGGPDAPECSSKEAL